MPNSAHLSPLRWGLVALLVSSALQFLCFLEWPGNPVRDVTYSIFAAQNLLAHGQLKSINVLADYGGDLAQSARLHFLVQFPPGHALLYAAVMALGLTPAAATKALGLAGIVSGGLGWVYLARFLGASRRCLVVVGAAYPWLPFIGAVYLAYGNDHLALALTPWICLALMRIEPMGTSSRWRGLLTVAILALLAVTFKYTLAPVFAAASLYLLAQDGFRFRDRRAWWTAALLALLLCPGLLLVLVDRAYRPRVMLAPVAGTVSGFGFVDNLLSNTVAGTPGWDGVLAGAGDLLIRFAIVPTPRLSALVSVALLAVWIAHFRRVPWRGREQSFGILLVLLTLALWAMLGVSNYFSRHQWDFSDQGRIYKPIALLWLLCGAVSLDKMRGAQLLRSVAFYTLVLPLAFTALAYLERGLLDAPYLRMPDSGMAWTATRDAGHAGFLSRVALSRGRTPNLLISAEPWAMVELAVPSLYSQLTLQRGGYWSRTPLEVWAMINPGERDALLTACEGASVERVLVPAGYPFDLYILEFRATGR
jgi:hypothetical protein